MARNQDDWVSTLLQSKFFDYCDDHPELRKNEKNQFCVDCGLCFCKHCINSSANSQGCAHDHLLKIRKHVYNDVVRLLDMEEYLDCSDIQVYKTNGIEAVHLNPRIQSQTSRVKGWLCEACGRLTTARFCCIACKVSIDNGTKINQSPENTSSPNSETDHIPKVDAVENSYGNADGSSQSLTDHSSEVIQPPKLNQDLNPNKRKRPRKSSNPVRAPLF